MLSLLLPALCPVCSAALDDAETVICPACMLALPRLHSWRTADSLLADGGINISWFRYTHGSPFTKVVKSTKYYDLPRTGRRLGRLMAREVLADTAIDPGVPSLADVDVLVPVPLNWTRHLRRGYNQSRNIALGIADITGAAVADNLEARPHRTQTRGDRSRRLQNVSGIFRVTEPQLFDGLRLAVVDDVITTGATTEACRDAIYASGARPAWVGIVTLARTQN